MKTYDIAIVGGGIVGLATARELLTRRPHLRLTVVEKEVTLGLHQTGHNSGVIHSGIYYEPGSLKARLCVQGLADTYRYCEERGIPVERCGKVIVATAEAELLRLQALHERGVANGVEGLEMIGPDRLRELEPHCTGLLALWSPNTGIVDWRRLSLAYSEDVRERGGQILTGHAVTGITLKPDAIVLRTRRSELSARRILVCAGLQSDRLATLTQAPREPRIVPFRGDFWVLRWGRRHLVRNLIYPVPDPTFPFLGVHFTRRIEDGSIWLGPNAVLAFAREGYRRLDMRPSDLLETIAYPGFLRLAGRCWREGAAELWRDFSKLAFLRSLQRFIPELVESDLLPGPAGVRAQALSSNGRLVEDFVVNTQDSRVLHVRNAPSPAATSSLGIGRMIADRLEEAIA